MVKNRINTVFSFRKEVQKVLEKVIIDAEKFLNDMIDDFENQTDMKPNEAIMYKAMLFGSIKFGVVMGNITKSTGEKMNRRLEKIQFKEKEGEL